VDRTEDPLKNLSTPELVRHALEETKLYAKAEILHAKRELQDELRAAKRGGILFGVAGVLALCGLSVLFVSLALALPMAKALGALLVGVALLAIAGISALIGRKAIPKKPLPQTSERLKFDWTLAKERFA
jgi:hypothetical protein